MLEALVRSGVTAAPVRLRLAALLVEARQVKKARALLATIVPAGPEEEKWRRYIEARLLLAQEQAAPALVVFEGLLREPEHLPEGLLVGATFGAADARLELNGSDVADKVLENFLWRHHGSPYLDLAFRRLDQVYAQQEEPQEAELHKMAQKPQARRAALALFYVAKMQVRGHRPEKAAGSLGALLRANPMHALAPQAHMMAAELHAARGAFSNAVFSLEAAMRRADDPEVRAEIELRTGLLYLRQGEFLLATNLFQSAAGHSARIWPAATFNLALAWLNQKNYERFQEQYRLFSQREPESPLRSELVLEQGLVQARAGDERAEATLRVFLRDFPCHAREGEAHLALAELAFLAPHGGGVSPESASAAAEYLQVANAAPRTAEVAEQADYLAVFVADTEQPRDEEKVVARAQAFLRDHAGSALLAEVRMKLGQVYFRREDYANAESQMATLAREKPDGAHAEAALFLAGQSAMKLISADAIDRALGYFDDVARRNGPLKLYARQEQAIIQNRLGHETEAIDLYDIILAAQPAPDAELRQAALCAKGDNLLALGRTEPSKLSAAIAVFDGLAASGGATASWRNQALYKKAQALERLNRGADALAAYYDVLEKSAAADREYFWCYKAGFDAARLLEAQEQWKPAIGIYEKMARLDGPRTAETQARAKALRLEHFIWE